MTQIQELEACLEDKQEHINSLLKQVQNLQTDGVPVQHVPRPPGIAHRTMSRAVQTVAQLSVDTEATPPLSEATPPLLEAPDNSDDTLKDTSVTMDSVTEVRDSLDTAEAWPLCN